MAVTTRPYIGKGRVYMREAGAAEALAEVGNVSALSISAEDNEINLPDYTQGGGGNYSSIRRIDSVTCSITLHDLILNNLAAITRGTGSEEAAQTANLITETAYIGGFIPVGPSPTNVTVEDAGGAGTTYVEGTDYEIRTGGIFILSGGTITDATSVDITSDTSAREVIEAMTQSGKQYELYFDGLNEADSGSSVVLHAYKFAPGIGNELPMIGDEFAEITLEGELLIDTTKTGTGVSQYYKVEAAA